METSPGNRGKPAAPGRGETSPATIDGPMRYRLVITDLDGTLLDRRGRVSERNLAAIRRLQESGVEVIPATGRALRECDHVLDFINHEGHAVTAGGALVHDARDGSVVLCRGLAPDVVRHLAEVLASHDHLAQLLQDHTRAGVDYVIVGEQRFDPATEWWFETLPLTYRRVPSFAHHDEQGHTVRVGTVADGSMLAPIVDRLRNELGDLIAVQSWSALTAEAATGSPTHILEAFGRNVNKWTAIEALCGQYGIDPAETVAIGDGLNDLEMVRDAGLGIAMGNADARIEAVADMRVGHHDESGFADAADLVLAANKR